MEKWYNIYDKSDSYSMLKAIKTIDVHLVQALYRNSKDGIPYAIKVAENFGIVIMKFRGFGVYLPLRFKHNLLYNLVVVVDSMQVSSAQSSCDTIRISHGKCL